MKYTKVGFVSELDKPEFLKGKKGLTLDKFTLERLIAYLTSQKDEQYPPRLIFKTVADQRDDLQWLFDNNKITQEVYNKQMSFLDKVPGYVTSQLFIMEK